MIEPFSLMSLLAGPAMPLSQIGKVIESLPVMVSVEGAQVTPYAKARASILELATVVETYTTDLEQGLVGLYDIYDDLELFADTLDADSNLKKIMLMLQGLCNSVTPRVHDVLDQLDAFDRFAINHSTEVIDTEALYASKKSRAYMVTGLRFFKELNNLINQASCCSVEPSGEFIAEQDIQLLIKQSDDYFRQRTA